VARYLYKLMAYKDEYEVARLYTDGDFLKAVAKRFKGGTMKFHLAPPLLAKRDPVTGHLRKKVFGPWMMSAFGLLARLKFLRGTAIDPFGRSEERKGERALIDDYRQSISEVIAGLSPDNHALAVEIASIPEQIRGYGHVKERHLAPAKRKWADLMAAYRAGRSAPSSIAAE
jgi:indolepyruvate ferredoxin oxidoreductase